MDQESPARLKERIEAMIGRPIGHPPQVKEDTTEYLEIDSGTVLRLGGELYYVTGEATEGRFGIVEQPKFWVKYAYDLRDGSRKVIKLVFHEEFTTKIGAFRVRCRRDPDKESRILKLTEGDPRFMQGRTVRDRAGNNVRILDYIRGRSLFTHVPQIEQPHEVYFRETMPEILRRLAGSVEAIAMLHAHGEQHGDVRNDHILIERDTGVFRWIDFDYGVNYLDYDIWSAGNLVAYVVGKGIRTRQEAQRTLARLGDAGPGLEPEDSLMFYRYRLANLRKIFPYIPSALNELLMRFSVSTLDFYESLDELARDLRQVADLLGPQEQR
jgi:hypothetical protein